MGHGHPVTINVRVSGIDKLLSKLDPKHMTRALDRGLDDIVVQLGAKVIHEAPKKTGNLRRSVHPGPRSHLERTIVIGANYAAAVNNGTRPHIIVPRNRKTLRFAADASGRRLSGRPRSGADVVFAREVHHPGTRANPFIKRAVERTNCASIMAAAIRVSWKVA